MAKMTVITNTAGEVVGTANYTGEKGAPTMARLLAGPGRMVQEIDVAEDVQHLTASELHLKLQRVHFAAVKIGK